MITETTTTQQTEPRLSGVFAQALGCVFAGVGAGVALGVFCGVVGVDWLLCLGITGATLCIVAGVLLFWTFARDPIANALRWEMLLRELDEAEDEIESLKGFREDAATWKAEAKRLQVIINANSHYVQAESETDSVRQDAILLVDLYFASGESPTVRSMQENYKWAQDRFTSARQYLVARGVVGNSTTRTKWLVDTKEAAMIAL